MSWNTSGRPFEGQRIQQPNGGKNYGFLQSLKQYGVQTRFQSEDLSVTATAMSTNGSYHEPTTLPPPQRNRKLKLSSSDSSAIGIMRQPIKSQQQQGSSRAHHRRGHTMDELSVRQLTADQRDHHHPPLDRPPLDLTRPLPPIQANRQVLLPPIQGHAHNIQRSESGIDQSETMDEDVSVIIDSSHNGDSNQSCETSSDEELISDDDNSTNEVTLQSGLKFHDPSRSSFSSLAEVDLPKLNTSGQPFVTTLVQEQLLSEHETIMTGVSPAGMSPRVNNIVRAFEIKGPLDKSLLESALHSVVKLHPILSSSFHRHNDKLYCLIPQESSTLHLETPLSYEKPPELITLARRKAFEISVISHETVNSDSSKLIPNTPYIDFDDHLSIISCGKDDSPKQVVKLSQGQGGIVHNTGNIEPTIPKPSNLPKLPSIDSISFPPLIRAKLVCVKPNESILILSFSRVVCDYWSSCLFIRQLSHAYSQLERSPSHRPSLAVIRAANKRQEALDHADRTRSKAGYVKRNKLGNPDGGVRSHRRVGGVLGGVNDSGIRPSNAHFQQIAMRENLILLIRPRERLWKFWESIITVRIKSTRGLSRTKVIPPVRIPNGFGEITRTTGLVRPTTARFRPITARTRPQTAKRGSGFGMDAMALESMSGTKRDIQFIKIPDSIGAAFLEALPVEYSSKIASQELLSLMCFGVYVLMLGVCSKGWGLSDILSRHVGSDEGPGNESIPVPDPLLKYNKDNERLSQIMMGRGSTARRRSDTRKKMDVGSFLVGVNVSVRQLAPELTQGLFGPLSNIVGLRVDLSSSPTFADLMQSLWSNLQAVRCHAHYPFGFVAEDLGLVQGLPVQFSYLYPHDVLQLSNAEGFHFMESSVGVTGKALARFGSSCYMNPLSTKMDDNVQLELMMWESPRGGGVDGIFLHQTQSLRSEVVQAFSKEMLRLVSIVSEKPTVSLRELAAIVNPPYLHTASRSNR